MEITAYKCPHCGTLHEQTSSYRSCVKTCSAKKARKTKASKKEETKTYWWNYPRLNASTINELIEMCIEASIRLNGEKHAIRKLEFTQLAYIPEFLAGRWDYPLSPEHSNDSGVYRVLRGRVTHDFPYNEFSDGIGIRLGTGGPSGQTFTIFLDDFPKLSETITNIENQVRELDEFSKDAQRKLQSLKASNETYQSVLRQERDLEAELSRIQNELIQVRSIGHELVKEMAEPFSTEWGARQQNCNNEFGIRPNIPRFY